MGLKARRWRRGLSSFQFSDAWLLLAVHYGCGQHGGGLRSIIGAGDYINHAIFSYEELAGGLARLADAKLIWKRGERYRTTAAARRIWAQAGTSRMSRMCTLTRDFLGVAFVPGQSPKPFVGVTGSMVTREQFDEACRAYRRSF